MKNIIILLMYAGLFFSCEKIGKDKITINCYAINGGDQTPLSGYKINLKELKSGFPGVEVSVIATETTDNNGFCSFELDARKASKYNYEVEIIYDWAKIFDGKGFVDRVRLTKDENQNVELVLHERSAIVFTTKNINPFDDNDEIWINVTSSSYENETFYFHKGAESDENSRKNDAPAGPYDCKIIVMKNQLQTVKDTAFTAPKFGTVYFNYSY